MIGISVIGYGYWGPNLVRNFGEAPESRVISVSDLQPERRARAQKRHPGVEVTADYREVLADPRVDAVAIATPVSTHFDLALQALRAGKHVWIEKPIAPTVEQAQRLVEEADCRGLTLFVDHTFPYTSAVRKIRELVASGELGDVYYYDSVRVNLGLFQHDVNVIWDLAVHDLAIIDYVMPHPPRAVSATGMAHLPGEPENIAYMTLFFDSSVIAHLHVNWLAPVKVRRTLIGGSRKMIVYDDLEPSEKIKVYDKGVTVNSTATDQVYEALVGYRTGDMWAPQVEVSEALGVAVRHFAHCIQHGERPLTDGRAGLRVVRALEAATQSLQQRGRVIELEESACPV